MTTTTAAASALLRLLAAAGVFAAVGVRAWSSVSGPALPSNRQAAVGASVEPDKVLVFGGLSDLFAPSGATFYNDMYEFDFSGGGAGSLTTLPAGTGVPTGRGQSSVGFVPGVMYVAGGLLSGGAATAGVFAYNRSANAWSPAAGSLPAARAGMAHASCGTNMLVWGGEGGVSTFSDMYRIDMANGGSVTTIVQSGTPAGVTGATITVLQRTGDVFKLVNYGGWSGILVARSDSWIGTYDLASPDAISWAVNAPSTTPAQSFAGFAGFLDLPLFGCGTTFSGPVSSYYSIDPATNQYTLESGLFVAPISTGTYSRVEIAGSPRLFLTDGPSGLTYVVAPPGGTTGTSTGTTGSTGTTTGVATTGVATTGVATTGVATTGVATSGGGTTGVATTGIATTGATTGIATTAGATTAVATATSGVSTGVVTASVATTGPATTAATTTGSSSAPSSTTTETANGQSSGDDGGSGAFVVPDWIWIAGAVIVACLLAICAFAVFRATRRSRRGSKETTTTSAELDDGMSGVAATPMLGEGASSSGEHTGYSAIGGTGAMSTSSQRSVFDPSLLDARWKIDFSDLKLGHALAQGAFGVAYYAEYQANDCCVKQLHDTSDAAREELMREALQLSRLKPHASVCQFYGACVDPAQPLCLVTEFIKGGNLQSVLLKRHTPITALDVLSLAKDLAAGMASLHAGGTLHLDLACRNLLVLTHESPLKLRICDFGLAQTLPSGADSVSAAGCDVPWRWIDPQVTRDLLFRKETDVWAFAVCMYEMLARTRPYEGMTVAEIVPFVKQGGRLARPEATRESRVFVSPAVMDALYELMLRCWHEDLWRRPTFAQVAEELAALLKATRKAGRADDQVPDDLSEASESSDSSSSQDDSRSDYDDIGGHDDREAYAVLYAAGSVHEYGVLSATGAGTSSKSVDEDASSSDDDDDDDDGSASSISDQAPLGEDYGNLPLDSPRLRRNTKKNKAELMRGSSPKDIGYSDARAAPQPGPEYANLQLDQQ